MTALMLLILLISVKWHKHYEKAIINAIKVAGFADRAYFYDNSIDNQNAQLLFRTVDGKLAKQYVEALPQWTETILPEHRRALDYYGTS